MGFPGALVVLLIMITVIYVGITTYNRSSDKIPRQLSLYATIALISYYVHGIMNNFLDTEKLALPFWGAIAMIVVADILRERENMNKLLNY
jgi:hypothetical protein